MRAAALRQAQMGMIRKVVKIADGQLMLPEVKPIPLPTKLANQQTVNLSHPYYWSAYTVVGNWN